MNALLLALILSSTVSSETKTVRFVDVSGEAGVTLENLSGSGQKTFLVEVNGNGAAFFDYDEDGDIDLLVTSGSTLEQLPHGGSPMAVLYQNRGDGRFVDVTVASRLFARGWAMGVCVADVDNDGFADVYVTAYGRNVLWRNRGDGTFREVSSNAGVDDPRYGTGCSFGDYDRDGWLDLYAANYLSFDLEAASERGKTPDCQFMGVEVFCGPRRFVPESDVFYHNNGDGTFEDVTAASGLETTSSYGFGVISGDLDDDGWLDIYVANDSRPNFFFHNQGDGTFSEVALVSGVALSQEGRQQAGMGVDLGDYNNDGLLDIFVTNFSHEANALYRGGPELVFTEMSFGVGLGGASLSSLGWGAGLVDLDNDGWLDVFVANGHIYKEVDTHPQFGTEYAQRNQFFLNEKGRFREVTRESGGPLLRKTSSRGVAFGDFDDDGDLDIFVVNMDERPSLLRSELDSRNHWLRLHLIGVESNRDAIGTRITFPWSDGVRMAETRSGGSYLSHNDSRLHFGLGDATRVERLLIRWPSGRQEIVEDLASDTTFTLVEGKGIVRADPGK